MIKKNLFYLLIMYKSYILPTNNLQISFYLQIIDKSFPAPKTLILFFFLDFDIFKICFEFFKTSLYQYT